MIQLCSKKKEISSGVIDSSFVPLDTVYILKYLGVLVTNL